MRKRPSSEKEDDDIGLELNDGEFRIRRKIGSGSYGTIFLARNLKADENGREVDVVVKRETQSEKSCHLHHEFKCIQRLKKCEFIPDVFFYTQINESYYMAMDLKGPNLGELLKLCDDVFSVETVVHIARSMIPVFRYIHSKGILHRDLKPANIVIGAWPHDCTTIYLIDFGLSKQFIIRENGVKRHIPMKNPERHPRKSLTGTVRYASPNAHYGDQGRRDDLISFGFVLLFFLRGGHLPWMGITAETKEIKYRKILELKEGTSPEELCDGFPQEVRMYMEYVSDMSFQNKPDYNHILKIWKCCINREELDEDAPPDWMKGEIISQKWPPGKDPVGQSRELYSNSKI